MSNCNHDKCLRDGCEACCYCTKDLQERDDCGVETQSSWALRMGNRRRNKEDRVRSLEAKCAWRASLLERAKPYVAEVGEEGSVAARVWVVDYEKGPQ